MKIPSLHLAPMCNITNQATRQTVKELNCDITWSEMISSEGLVRQDLRNNKSLALAKKFSKNEHPYWVQIFGTNPQNMALAAKIIEQEIQPTGLDINLGCPVPKAQKGGYGAIQLKNISAVVEIIKEIKKTISLPLSLKTRLGLKEPTEILDFATQLTEAGLDQLVVHARTLQGMFSEKPNWQIVKKLNKSLSIPIVYNGGIKTPEDAKFYLEKTNCQNLMIGQASLGNPWLFSEIKYFLKHNRHLQISPDTKKRHILQHAELVNKYFTEKGFIGFRTQFSAYLRHLQAPKSLRQQAVQITNLNDVRNIIHKL
jgi:tRNA-dihydrouridine synthase B